MAPADLAAAGEKDEAEERPPPCGHTQHGVAKRSRCEPLPWVEWLCQLAASQSKASILARRSN